MTSDKKRKQFTSCRNIWYRRIRIQFFIKKVNFVKFNMPKSINIIIGKIKREITHF